MTWWRIALPVGLLACADAPNAPLAPPSPSAGDYAALAAWFAERGIQLPANPPARPAAKVAQAVRILGDGDRDGDNDFWDLWYLWNHLTDGYTFSWYDLDALDINRNGAPDWLDLGLLGDYLYGSGENPHGIGQPIEEALAASLTPDPAEAGIEADGVWHRFVVKVTTISGRPSDRQVRVTVNPSAGATPLVLEISRRNTPPPSNYCGAEADDTRTVGDGEVLYLSGCLAGPATILIEDTDGTFVGSYGFDVEAPGTRDDSFDIDLVFAPGEFTTTQQSFIRRAADLWEQIVTAGLEDVHIDFDSDEISWWDSYSAPFTLGRIEASGTIDDVQIYVTKLRGGSSLGRGGPFWIRTSNSLPILGVIAFSDALLTRPEHVVVDVAEHEFAHVLGFGTLWDNLGLLENPSVHDATADTYFNGPLARDAFTTAGGWQYEGNRVPVENHGDDSHWRHSVFSLEVMIPYADALRREVALSDITIQSFADLGYQVDRSLADPYTVQVASTKLVAVAGRGEPWCKVLPLPPFPMEPSP